jgi:hypothetical protein
VAPRDAPGAARPVRQPDPSQPGRRSLRAVSGGGAGPEPGGSGPRRPAPDR